MLKIKNKEQAKENPFDTADDADTNFEGQVVPPLDTARTSILNEVMEGTDLIMSQIENNKIITTNAFNSANF